MWEFWKSTSTPSSIAGGKCACNHLLKLVYRDKSVKEHYIRLKSNDARIFYPSLDSIAARLELASKAGYGVCIWEIGQGLTHFFELL